MQRIVTGIQIYWISTRDRCQPLTLVYCCMKTKIKWSKKRGEKLRIMKVALLSPFLLSVFCYHLNGNNKWYEIFYFNFFFRFACSTSQSSTYIFVLTKKKREWRKNHRRLTKNPHMTSLFMFMLKTKKYIYGLQTSRGNWLLELQTPHQQQNKKPHRCIGGRKQKNFRFPNIYVL